MDSSEDFKFTIQEAKREHADKLIEITSMSFEELEGFSTNINEHAPGISFLFDLLESGISSVGKMYIAVTGNGSQ